MFNAAGKSEKVTRRLKDVFFNSFVRPWGPGVDDDSRMLGYHTVGDVVSRISIPEERFGEQIRWLLDHGYRIVSLKEWWRLYKETGKAPSRLAVLTFDDGFRGLLDSVAPLLTKLGITATVFLIAGEIGRTNRFDRPLGTPELPMLSWEEIFELKNLGWDFQSHGVHHYPVIGLPDEMLEEEVSGSKKRLEDRLDEPVDFFCYPYGAFDKRAVEAVEKAGYRGAVTCWAGTLADDAAADPYRLKRVLADDLRTIDDFAFRFSPAYRRVSRLWFQFRRFRQIHTECFLSEIDKRLVNMVPQV